MHKELSTSRICVFLVVKLSLCDILQSQWHRVLLYIGPAKKMLALNCVFVDHLKQFVWPWINTIVASQIQRPRWTITRWFATFSFDIQHRSRKCPRNSVGRHGDTIRSYMQTDYSGQTYYHVKDLRILNGNYNPDTLHIYD